MLMGMVDTMVQMMDRSIWEQIRMITTTTSMGEIEGEWPDAAPAAPVPPVDQNWLAAIANQNEKLNQAEVMAQDLSQQSQSSLTLSLQVPSVALSSLSVNAAAQEAGLSVDEIPPQPLPLALIPDLNQLANADDDLINILDVQPVVGENLAVQPGQLDLDMQLGMVLVPQIELHSEWECQTSKSSNGPFSNWFATKTLSRSIATPWADMM